MNGLVEKIERAGGPDRELDALIHFSTNERWVGRLTSWPPTMIRKPDMEPGLYMCIEGDGYCFGDNVPAYTESLNAAVTLVPEGWYWRAGHGVLWPGWAHLNHKHPDHCDRADEQSSHAETPELALCAAALRARGFS